MQVRSCLKAFFLSISFQGSSSSSFSSPVVFLFPRGVLFEVFEGDSGLRIGWAPSDAATWADLGVVGLTPMGPTCGGGCVEVSEAACIPTARMDETCATGVCVMGRGREGSDCSLVIPGNGGLGPAFASNAALAFVRGDNDTGACQDLIFNSVLVAKVTLDH